MNNIIFIFYLLMLIVLKVNLVKVSPKLDFIDSKETSADTDSTLIRTSPKIQGVRVVVDTTKLKKQAESRSDEDKNDPNGGNVKKTVGIRTDITFEISEDDVNSTKVNKPNNKEHRNIDDDDDDDSETVPIFKGTRTKSSWDNNVPVFHRTDDESTNRRSGNDNWSNFIPPATGVWTTEKNPYAVRHRVQPLKTQYVPYMITQKSWTPCLCSTDNSWRNTNNDVERRSFGGLQPTSEKPLIGVADKLERPFSNDY